MIKTLLKLVAAAVVVYASWHAGAAYWRYFIFKDEVHDIAQFSGNKTELQMQTRVLEVAAQQHVPLDAEHLTVHHDPNHTTIIAVYTENIELAPSYIYPWEFKVNVDAFTSVP
jgi:hypothetical protein